MMINTYDAEIAKAIGKKVFDIRRRYMFCQSELAELVGIGEKAVSKIENGRYIPSLMVLKKIAEIDGKTLSGFLKGVC